MILRLVDSIYSSLDLCDVQQSGREIFTVKDKDEIG